MNQLQKQSESENAIGSYHAGGELSLGEFSSRDIILPRAIILHSDSKEEGLLSGMIINSLTRQELKGTFIPLFVYKSYVKFGDELKAEWSTMDRTDPRVVEGLKWNINERSKKNEKPEVTEFINFACVFNEDLSFPVILGFKSTSLKKGKTLLTLCLMQSGQAPIPGTSKTQFDRKHRYEIGVEEIDGIKTYWIPTFSVPKDKMVFEIDNELQEKLNEMAKSTANLIGGVSSEDYVESQESVEL